jgi:FkbM family methyltransferase
VDLSVSARVKGAVRRIPLIRALVASASFQHLIEATRMAGAVHLPLRFVALQMTPSRAAAHRLRDSGLTIYLRHRTRDIDIFNEVFGRGPEAASYAPPRQLAEALDAKAGPTILDVGGNIGLFGAYAAGRWPGAKIRSYEPDPTNLPIISRVISVNGLQGRWALEPVAVANSEVDLPFVSGLFAESKLATIPQASAHHPLAARADEGETISVHAVDLFEQDHDVDLLKMDIEGGEWSILTDPRLDSLKADAIVLEWHASGCPVDDPRAATIELLGAAGYLNVEETENFGYTGLLWAWR